MSYTNAVNLGPAHTEWLASLDFYKKEIEMLERRLAEVAGKNTGIEAMAGAEHFQNQFIVQKNNIDELRHNINSHTHEVFTDIRDHVGRVEETKVSDHNKLGEEVKSVEKIINDLRHEFNQYLSKWF